MMSSLGLTSLEGPLHHPLWTFYSAYLCRHRTLLLIVAWSVVFLWPSFCRANNLAELEEVVDESRLTFARFTGHPSMSWFKNHARNARVVFIAPRVAKGSYFFGGTWGTGVLLVRDSSTGRWSEPAFYRLVGASFGLQIGALHSEIIALATDDDAAAEMQDGTFTLGVGGQLGVARTGGGIGGSLDITSGTRYLTVSTSTGFFAGVAAGATVVLVRDSANELYYGQPVELSDLSAGLVRQWYSQRLIRTVAAATAEEGASQP
jgi:lipid-binding SYLF domain-containing protein